MLRRLIGLLGMRPARFALSVALGALAVVAGSALAGVAGYLICRAARQPPILSLTVLTAAVRTFALARPSARYAERLASHDLAFRSLGHVRTTVFASLERIAPAGYRDGELLARLVADVDRLADLALRVLLPAGVAVVAGAAIVAGESVVAPEAGALLAAGLCAAATIPPVVAATVTSRSARRQSALRARLSADLVDALDAAEELWLNDADTWAADRIAADDRALVEVSRRDARGAGAADALTMVIGGVTALSILVVTTAAAGRGALDPLLVVPLTLVALGAFDAVAGLSTAARHLPGVRSAGRRVLEIVDAEPAVTDPAGSVPVDRAAGGQTDLVLQAVTVERGADHRRVLDGVGMTLPAGERMVLSGPSGAGKTTLAYLLVRFLERQRGSARLGGHDLRDYDQADVRARILLSEQEPHIFAGTIRANVALARPGASEAEICRALARAQLGEWAAALPDGLDTPVGERGRRLSGGQRQRLALARAFLADPGVLILDEPTAHLDDATASALLADIWREAGSRSVLLAGHGGLGPFDGCPRLELATPVHPG